MTTKIHRRLLGFTDASGLHTTGTLTATSSKADMPLVRPLAAEHSLVSRLANADVYVGVRKAVAKPSSIGGWQ